MKYRKGVFLVVFRGKGKREYLILRRVLHWKGWEFPKGGIEPGETETEAVKRELREETRLKTNKIFKFKKEGKFRYSRKLKDRPGLIGQNWKLFAVRVGAGKVKISRKEHSRYKWLDFKQTLRLLKWKDQRACLKLVERKLNK